MRKKSEDLMKKILETKKNEFQGPVWKTEDIRVYYDPDINGLVEDSYFSMSIKDDKIQLCHFRYGKIHIRLEGNPETDSYFKRSCLSLINGVIQTIDESL
jgi:hypothetical protein